MSVRRVSWGDIALSAARGLLDAWKERLVPALRGASSAPKSRAKTEILYRIYSLMQGLASLNCNEAIIATVVVSRSILEHCVDLLFIESQPSSVAERYMAYRKLEIYRCLSESHPSFDEARAQKVIAPILAKHYPGKKVRDIRSWWPMSMKKKCDLVGEDTWYESYRIMCWATHNDPTFTVNAPSALIGQCRDVALVDAMKGMWRVTYLFLEHCPVAGNVVRGSVERLDTEFVLQLANTPPPIPGKKSPCP